MNAPKIREMLMQLKAQLFALETELLAPTDPTADETDLLSGDSSIPIDALELVTGPHCWPGVRLNESWKEFAAIVGMGKIQTGAQWAAYARVIKLYPGKKTSPGYPWRNIIGAAIAAEPDKRWALDLEKVLRDKARSNTSAY